MSRSAALDGLTPNRTHSPARDVRAATNTATTPTSPASQIAGTRPEINSHTKLEASTGVIWAAAHRRLQTITQPTLARVRGLAGVETKPVNFWDEPVVAKPRKEGVMHASDAI